MKTCVCLLFIVACVVAIPADKPQGTPVKTENKNQPAPAAAVGAKLQNGNGPQQPSQAAYGQQQQQQKQQPQQQQQSAKPVAAAGQKPARLVKREDKKPGVPAAKPQAEVKPQGYVSQNAKPAATKRDAPTQAQSNQKGRPTTASPQQQVKTGSQQAPAAAKPKH